MLLRYSSDCSYMNALLPVLVAQYRQNMRGRCCRLSVTVSYRLYKHLSQAVFKQVGTLHSLYVHPICQTFRELRTSGRREDAQPQLEY